MEAKALKVLRVVTLASATGKYGGPFDTARSQCRLIVRDAHLRTTLLAGHLAHDAPLLESNSYQAVFRKVLRLGGRSGFTTCFSWPMIVELVKQVRRSDVVHVSYARELIPLSAAILALILRRALILQPHGMLTARSSRLHAVADFIVRPIFCRANRIIALTNLEKLQLESWARRTSLIKFDVIGNPLPYASVSTTADAASNMAVFIARLEPRKRVADFVEARRIAHERGWQETYEIYGPDQGDATVVRDAAEKIPGLIYGGPVPAEDIDGILAHAGVFVLTSENEPWGNVLVAALFKGVPVVVTRSAALAEEIQNNHLGVVVPDGDAAAVAAAVHTILTENWRSYDEAESAREFARRRFDQSKITQALLSSYRMAMDAVGDQRT